MGDKREKTGGGGGGAAASERERKATHNSEFTANVLVCRDLSEPT